MIKMYVRVNGEHIGEAEMRLEGKVALVTGGGRDEAYFRGAYVGMGGYVAAKAGLVGLTRALADELAGAGNRVHAVCPGYVETQLVREELDRLAGERGITPDAMRARLSRFSK